MRRTFTLRWLFVVVTMVCVLAALAGAFPGIAFIVALVAGTFVPAWIVVRTFCVFSSRPAAVIGVGIPAALLGGITGCALFPSVFVNYAYDANSPPSAWELYVEPFLPIAACAMAAALVACVVALWFFPRNAKVNSFVRAPRAAA
jgi:hypothetical protein